MALLRAPATDRGRGREVHSFLTKAILEAEAKGPMSFAERGEGVLHQVVLSNTAESLSGSVRRY